jgi:hypothetical protein
MSMEFQSKCAPRTEFPRKSCPMANFVSLKKIAEDLDLEKILFRCPSSNEVWPVLTFAMNYAIRPKALTPIQRWFEGTIAQKNCGLSGR